MFMLLYNGTPGAGISYTIVINTRKKTKGHCSHSQSSISATLSKSISDFSLIDVFRSINPTVKQYSFYSGRHKTYSRTDYILTSSSISEIHNAVLSPTPLSDHSIILVKLTLPNTPTRAARWHFNMTLFKSEEYCVYFQRELSRFVAENTGSVNDP